MLALPSRERGFAFATLSLHGARMDPRGRWKAAGRNPTVKLALLILGVLLLAAAPLVGVFPGPGGIVVAAAGLTLVLRNSRWAKRRYVRFKHWQPRAGSWFDWGMRRPSARRREALRKVRNGLPPPSPD